MDKLTLKAVRVSQGLTLREVANKVDRNFQTISKYEKDSTKIPADLLMKLLNLYDTPIESIFLGKSTKKTVLWIQQKGSQSPNYQAFFNDELKHNTMQASRVIGFRKVISHDYLLLYIWEIILVQLVYCKFFQLKFFVG